MLYCSKCGTKKGEFTRYSKRINVDGTVRYYYYCRPHNNKRARKYRKTERGKQVYYEMMRKQDKKFKEKISARQKVRWALINGKIKRPKICGECKQNKKLDAHHPRYCEPLNVKWMCRSCHVSLHRK